MSVLNKITIGYKLVLEIDHDPTVVGTPAPVGSEALRNDANVGKAYLKYGPNDTDWASFQTGVDTAGWAYADSIANLNSASMPMYFGTKDANHDIIMVRNSVEMMRFSSGLIKLKQFVLFDGLSGEVASNGAFLNLKAPIVRQTANSYTEIDSELNALERKYMKSNSATLASGLNQSRPTPDLPQTESIMEVVTTVIDPTDNTKFAQWVKTYRVHKANGIAGAVTVELLQDDMTKRSQAMGNLRVSHTIDLNQVTTSFTNAPDANNYQISTFVKELIAKI